MPGTRPPVFLKEKAALNVLMNPDAAPDEERRLLEAIPDRERHRWFRSMTSSQALAQSILGNLKIYDGLRHLTELTDDGGLPLLGGAEISSDNLILEYSVDQLGEPRPTSVDCFVKGRYQVAIECKLSESEVGACSRPRLRKQDSNYERDFCDGTYSCQRSRVSRCSLTELGVLYWEYVPEVFKWRNDVDHRPCPLHRNYQLVRNVLAACVRADGLSIGECHALLIYDERNPAFQEGGKGFKAFKEVREALYEPALLRKCSWQRIVRDIVDRDDFQWLTDELALKYGFTCR